MPRQPQCWVSRGALYHASLNILVFPGVLCLASLKMLVWCLASLKVLVLPGVFGLQVAAHAPLPTPDGISSDHTSVDDRCELDGCNK